MPTIAVPSAGPSSPTPHRLRGLRLDQKAALPLHAQVEQRLRTFIAEPEYVAGRLLPDEVTLASALGVSRNTLRAAIARLVQEGRLERRAGVGTRVIEPKVHSGIGAWQSFTREMAAKGITAEDHSTRAEHRPVPEAAARALQIPEGTPAWCIERVRGWDGRPEVHFLSFLHPRLRLGESLDLAQPLYALIAERDGAVADESIEELQAINADRRLARLLAVKTGTALLRRERTVLDTARRPLEFALVHYRCKRFALTLRLRQG